MLLMPTSSLTTLFSSLTLLTACATAAAAEDRMLADFEGSGFGDWKSTGEAFGSGPATGALPGQMPVEGFAGAGLANSYHGGDDAIGTLTSPPFRIDRKHLNFLIGGGGFAGETCLNLRVGGKVVRTATGPNTAPGGSERLEWKSWNLADLQGREATLEVIDSRKGGWGHINVDQLLLSDQPRVISIQKTFTIDQRYLVWPVSQDRDPRRRFFLTLDGADRPLTFAGIRLSAKPDFWVFTDLADYRGRKVTVTGEIPAELAAAWEQVSIRSDYPGQDQLYREPLRPQYHFTSRRGWLNDPNGLVWAEGTWHLFYQHNAYNHGWDNMSWGHATSPDLFHWTEGPDALLPDAEGYMYSGSGFVVPPGLSALPVANNGKPVLGFAYTAEGTHSYEPGGKATQSLAFCDDGGKTLKKFAGNPVLPHQIGGNRDPKIFWHAPSKHWVMALYHDGDEYGIYTSPDLVKWERTSTYHIPGDSECPDLFELPVEGDSHETRWVVWGATGHYRLGRFDGRTFTPETAPLRHYFGAAYAGQTYDHAPDGRRVHIGWMRDGGAGLTGAPFNLQMSLPMDFALRREDGAVRLWIEPSREVTALRSATREWSDLTVEPGGQDPLADFKGGQFEIEAVIDASSPAAGMGFRIFGDSQAVWRKADRRFSGIEGPLAAVDGKLHIRVFVDTVTMEVFVNGSYTGRYLRQSPDREPVRIVADGGAVHFESLKIHTLRSVWMK